MNYSTQTEAKTFCEIFNLVNGRGYTASFVRVSPCDYKISIQKCKTFKHNFFGGKQ